MNWVKLKKYCELSGDTMNAVHSKRRKGIWLDGQHCRLAPDGNLFRGRKMDRKKRLIIF